MPRKKVIKYPESSFDKEKEFPLTEHPCLTIFQCLAKSDEGIIAHYQSHELVHKFCPNKKCVWTQAVFSKTISTAVTEAGCEIRCSVRKSEHLLPGTACDTVTRCDIRCGMYEKHFLFTHLLIRGHYCSKYSHWLALIKRYTPLSGCSRLLYIYVCRRPRCVVIMLG